MEIQQGNLIFVLILDNVLLSDVNRTVIISLLYKLHIPVGA